METNQLSLPGVQMISGANLNIFYELNFHKALSVNNYRFDISPYITNPSACLSIMAASKSLKGIGGFIPLLEEVPVPGRSLARVCIGLSLVART